MTTASIAAPSLFSQTESIVGPPIVYATALQVALADGGIAGEDILPFGWDFSGTGTETVRFSFRSGIGAGNLMTARAHETAAIVPTGYTRGYWTGSVASYVLGFGQSRKDRSLSLPGQSVQADEAGMLHAESAITTLHYLHAVAASSLTNVEGTSAATFSVQTILDVVDYFESVAGYTGGAFGFLDPKQIREVRAAFASYTGLQFPEPTNAIQSLSAAAPEVPVLAIFGLSAYKSNWIQSSGGDLQGWFQAPGKFVRTRVRHATMPDLIEVGRDDNFGIVTTAESSSEQSYTAVHTEMLAGVATADDLVVPGTRARSVA